MWQHVRGISISTSAAWQALVSASSSTPTSHLLCPLRTRGPVDPTTRAILPSVIAWPRAVFMRKLPAVNSRSSGETCINRNSQTAGRSGHDRGRIQANESIGKHESAYLVTSSSRPTPNPPGADEAIARASGFSDAILLLVGACGGAVNNVLFALVKGHRSFEECAATDRAAEL